MEPPLCECEPNSCPVEEKCQTTGVVYQATVKPQGEKEEKYIGLTARFFIQRQSLMDLKLPKRRMSPAYDA